MARNNPQMPDEEPEELRRQRESLAIQEALRGLRYGAVNVIVQDGVVVQIDRTEKRRLVKAKDHPTRE